MPFSLLPPVAIWFHTARVIGDRRWFLGASTEWPGVIPADAEIGNLEALVRKYPDVAADLRAIAASVQQVVPSGVGVAVGGSSPRLRHRRVEEWRHHRDQDVGSAQDG